MISVKRFGAAVLLTSALPLRLWAQPAPVGSEFRVNTWTTGTQRSPSVAADSAGNFVVVWQSDQSGYSIDVYAQRYDSTGTPLGAEFLVNTYTPNTQNVPVVAAGSAGNFVVVWESRLQDGQGYGIFGQRYDSAGTPLGGEFRVNTYTRDNQYNPSVAADGAGNFVVVWASSYQEGTSYSQGIYAQRYDSAGTPLGSEFHVNTYTTAGQRFPSVAADSTGNFLVVWQSHNGQDGNFVGVFGQRYSSAGTAQGSEFRVNSFTTGNQDYPAVAADGAGNFVVVWTDSGQGDGVFGQRYDSAGMTLGGEFQVNTSANFTRYPAVAADSTGQFVVVWRQSDSDSDGVFGRGFDSSGTGIGGEFRVNSYTTNRQQYPAVAAGSGGDFVVVWTSRFQDGGDDGVFGLRYCTITTCTDGDDCCPIGCTIANDNDCPPPTTTTSSTTSTSTTSTTSTSTSTSTTTSTSRTSTTSTSRTTTTSTSTSTTTTTLAAAVGHLKCYKTKDARAKAAYTLDLIAGVAGFPNEPGCALKLGAKGLCVEVSKQNVVPSPPGGGPPIPPNAGSVFLSYKLKCAKQTIAPAALADQFGPGTFTVVKAAELLVPALPGPANDHFKCYKVKDARPKASYTLNLIAGVSGFVNETGCAVKVGAKLICVQVKKQNVVPSPPGGGPGAGPNSGAKFISYKLKCPKGVVPPASFTDQFGAGTFTPGTAKKLLVPAQ